MVNADEKINRILKGMTGTYEDLLSLRDDIWIGLDHSSIEEVEAASEFQKQYIRLLDQFVKNSEEIATLVTQFTAVKEKDKMKELQLEKDIIHPILKGDNVESFFYDWSGTYIIYPYDKDNNVISEKDLKQNFPNIYKYLISQRENLKGRDYFDKSSKNWYELWCERSYKKFCQKKIVNCEISANNRFAVDEYNYFGNTKIFNTVLQDKYIHLYDFITGLLNSNVINYFEKQISTPKAGGAYEHKTQFIEQYPIMFGSEKQQKEIGDLSSKIASLKHEDIDADVTELTKELNKKVYELYKLTPDEIVIIEAN